VIYAERNKVLDGANMRDTILKMINDEIENVVGRCISDEIPAQEWDLKDLNQTLTKIIPIAPRMYDESMKHMKRDELVHSIKEEAIKLYEHKETEFPTAEAMREMERVVLLRVVDSKWMNHIDDMEQLRQGIGLQALGQRDPLIEYKMDAFAMFEDMTKSITEDTVRMIYHVQVERKLEREAAAKVTGTNKDDTVKAPTRRNVVKKLYPNDPCPCGSGKKFKQCHGRPGATPLPGMKPR
jgi:preprotein translocase subunit SecA